MYIIEADGHELIGLTYRDEINLATSVMDCLSLRWVQGGFASLLENIYYHKCMTGSMLRMDEMMEYLEYCQRYDIISAEIENTGTSIWSDLDLVYQDRKDRVAEVRNTVIRAWREVWERHPTFRTMADGYKSFPGDDLRDRQVDTGEDLVAAQDQLEHDFWKEVNRVHDSYLADGYTPSRSEVIIEVSDYMPRNILELD